MSERLWVVIPAAGVGRRMASASKQVPMPKQYLQLGDRAVIECSLAPFLARTDIAGIVVVLAAGDMRFNSLAVSRDTRIRTTTGGTVRANSVSSGIDALSANDQDWVLVHDAARPCLHPVDLERLISEVKTDAVGGLLAVPMADTLKKGDVDQRAETTITRDAVWRALTPQMFRFGLLQRALREADGKGVTDESSALELLGFKPRLIVGRTDNIKITIAEDLPYAEFILRQRDRI